MRRAIAVAVISLLLGMVLSLAVAFGLARWRSSPYQVDPITGMVEDYGDEFEPSPSDIRQWRQHVPDHWPKPPEVGLESRFIGVRYLSQLVMHGSFDAESVPPEQFAEHLAKRRGYMFWILECGFPFHCIGSESWYETQGAMQLPVQYSGRKLGSVYLPARIIIPGFFANTLLYGSILALPYLGLWCLKRLHRRRRGRCPSCNYDLRQNLAAGCSECGWKRQ